MGYNRKILFKKISAVQEITKRFQEQDVPLTKIYRKHIENQFYISMSTYKNYLATSPREMKLELEGKTEQTEKTEQKKPKKIIINDKRKKSKAKKRKANVDEP